ncbi:hypothetical protein P8935_05125 [Telmatobacter sp. DSM 110680]|uniref:SMODS and SLOG-associating 2TM effector domain-containing protein n=1 Tax=Telmatobacter sp. DSM 110680 TaxID=3036704 RepID=A0AAU7DLB9_9BACT
MQQSQLLIALWDGEPSVAKDGTQEIVSFAGGIGRPVIWIHSKTGAIQILNEPALKRIQQTHDQELNFLNGLSDMGETLLTDSPAELARAWLQKLDKNASRFAPQVRRLSSIPIMYTAAAAFSSGAGLQMPHSKVWLGIGTALGITAAAIPIVLRLSQRQTRWARTRTAAEVCRSVLALWDSPDEYQVIGPEIIPELAGALRSLKLLRALDGSRSEMALDEFKRRYRLERISQQLQYFSTHAVQSGSEARNYRIASCLCIGLAILISMWLFVDGKELAIAHSFVGKRGLAVAVSALFQLATISGAFLIVKDCKRRQWRYRELHNCLKEWDSELSALRTWTTVMNVTCRVERALLVELLEWRFLVRNVKLTRK